MYCAGPGRRQTVGTYSAYLQRASTIASLSVSIGTYYPPKVWTNILPLRRTTCTVARCAAHVRSNNYECVMLNVNFTLEKARHIHETLGILLDYSIRPHLSMHERITYHLHILFRIGHNRSQ